MKQFDPTIEPVFAPTPGQRLVLYDDQERIAAGGVITRLEASIVPG